MRTQHRAVCPNAWHSQRVCEQLQRSACLLGLVPVDGPRGYSFSPSRSFFILFCSVNPNDLLRACDRCGAENALLRQLWQGNLPAVGIQCPELPEAEALINASVFFSLC